ncbi:IS200/IS605 family transposase [Chryseobacterium sp. GP-SGM7]|uniref:IS200/IS605 family transposase n=1 Tax=Chryseobacterium sp. GP-SGM7 TaxID=3411323 RepID=UPI003B9383AD
MSQSLVKNYVHIIFSTKHRNDFIDESIEEELFAYIYTICKNLNSPSIKIGGTDNHIHILLTLSPKYALMKVVQEIKAHSSRWIKTKGRKYEDFFWQDGYGAFSVSQKHIYATINYIRNQREHHKNEDFKTEFINILDKYKTNYDEKYLWN